MQRKTQQQLFFGPKCALVVVLLGWCILQTTPSQEVGLKSKRSAWLSGKERIDPATLMKTDDSVGVATAPEQRSPAFLQVAARKVLVGAAPSEAAVAASAPLAPAEGTAAVVPQAPSESAPAGVATPPGVAPAVAPAAPAKISGPSGTAMDAALAAQQAKAAADAAAAASPTAMQAIDGAAAAQAVAVQAQKIAKDALRMAEHASKKVDQMHQQMRDAAQAHAAELNKVDIPPPKMPPPAPVPTMPANMAMMMPTAVPMIAR